MRNQVEKRYVCYACRQTFTSSKDTLFYRLRMEAHTVLLVITLLAYGCPLQAIVKAFGFHERTVKNWWQRTGDHCRLVHEHAIGGCQFDLHRCKAMK